MKFFICLLISSILMGTIISPTLVLAQSAGVSSAQYRLLLENYRSRQDRFSIAVSSYYALRTFAAQEEAVATGRDLFLTRVDVLSSYFLGLQESLLSQTTVDLEQKEDISNQISTLLNTLSQHRSRVDVATDRIKLDSEAVWLSSQEKELLRISDRAQALIRIGHMQHSYANLLLVREQISETVKNAPISETRRIEKQRGIEELERNLEAVRGNIDQAMALYVQSIARTSDAGVSVRIMDQLSAAYIKILSGISLAQELSSDV